MTEPAPDQVVDLEDLQDLDALSALPGPDEADEPAAPGAPQVRYAAGAKVPHLTRAEQVALGVAEKSRVSRRLHGGHTPAPDRDPIAILEAQAATRVAELVPLRYGRMLASPFAFYRGAAAVMAADLAPAPRTRLHVQLCGDAHLSNFGIYNSAERQLVFDVNDFDETLPGPFEWDLKRLAASFVVAGRALGWKRAYGERALIYAMTSYRERMAELSGAGTLPTWYARISADDMRTIMAPSRRKSFSTRLETVAARRNNLGALDKLTHLVAGERKFIENPPVIVRITDTLTDEMIRNTIRQYRRTLPSDRRALLDRYRFVDVARKVVGVGSVGTVALVGYFEGVDEGDPLFLQVKQAQASVLEPYLGRAAQRHHGQRVVDGQRLLQATSDVFLGWATGPFGRHYYWRQLWDGKLAADIEGMDIGGIYAYAKVCGWALARAHARSKSPVAIAAYLGSGAKFTRSMIEFSEAYADQNQQDYTALQDAVASGRLQAITGV
jgi:uncharacterized protein (DUF2252 family)